MDLTPFEAFKRWNDIHEDPDLPEGWFVEIAWDPLRDPGDGQFHEVEPKFYTFTSRREMLDDMEQLNDILGGMAEVTRCNNYVNYRVLRRGPIARGPETRAHSVQ